MKAILLFSLLAALSVGLCGQTKPAGAKPPTTQGAPAGITISDPLYPFPIEQRVQVL